MQTAVNTEIDDLMGQEVAPSLGLSLGGINGNRDVAQGTMGATRKGEHIRRFVFAAVLSVELAKGEIIGKQNRYFALRHTIGAQEMGKGIMDGGVSDSRVGLVPNQYQIGAHG